MTVTVAAGKKTRESQSHHLKSTNWNLISTLASSLCDQLRKEFNGTNNAQTSKTLDQLKVSLHSKQALLISQYRPQSTTYSRLLLLLWTCLCLRHRTKRSCCWPVRAERPLLKEGRKRELLLTIHLYFYSPFPLPRRGFGNRGLVGYSLSGCWWIWTIHDAVKDLLQRIPWIYAWISSHVYVAW